MEGLHPRIAAALEAGGAVAALHPEPFGVTGGVVLRRRPAQGQGIGMEGLPLEALAQLLQERLDRPGRMGVGTRAGARWPAAAVGPSAGWS